MPKYIFNGELDIEPLISARNFLKKALSEAEDEIDEMAAVQAFEVCYELAWKTCKKILNLRGVSILYSPKKFFGQRD